MVFVKSLPKPKLSLDGSLLWMSFAFSFFVFLALGTSVAFGATPDTHVLDSVLTRFKNETFRWQDILYQAALAIFWVLALISLTWQMIRAWMLGTDIKGLFQQLLQPGLFIAIFYMLLTNGVSIGIAIIHSGMQLATNATLVPDLFSPSAVVDLAFRLCNLMFATGNKIMEAGGISDFAPYAVGLSFWAVGIFLWVVVISIALTMLVTLVSSWVVVYGGLIVLAFGGGFGIGLSDKAKNYFQTMIAMGLRLMGIGLLIGIAMQIMTGLANDAEVAVRAGNNPTFNDALVILMVGMVFKAMITTIPELLVGIVNGQIGHMGNVGGGMLSGAVGATMATAGLATGLVMGGYSAVRGAMAGRGIGKVSDAIKQATSAVTSRVTGGGQGGGSSGAGSHFSGGAGGVASSFGGGSVGGDSGAQAHPLGGQSTPYSQATGTTTGKNLNAQPMSDYDAVMQNRSQGGGSTSASGSSSTSQFSGESSGGGNSIGGESGTSSVAQEFGGVESYAQDSQSMRANSPLGGLGDMFGGSHFAPNTSANQKDGKTNFGSGNHIKANETLSNMSTEELTSLISGLTASANYQRGIQQHYQHNALNHGRNILRHTRNLGQSINRLFM